MLEPALLDQVRPTLERIRPMSAVFEKRFVKRLDGPNVKQGKTKRDLAEQLIADIADFKQREGADRLVMIWCGSTEIHSVPSAVHASVEAFEKGLEENDPEIAPSQIYAYAALKSGVPFANGAPNLTVDTDAMLRV